MAVNKHPAYEQHEVTENDLTLRNDQNVFHKVVFNSDEKKIIAFPDYDNSGNHLAIFFGDGHIATKYIIDITNNRYHEHLLDILIHKKFGDSKIVQLGIFNRIQEAISQYYVDIKGRKYFYLENSKNSIIYSLSIEITHHTKKRINICLLDEDILIDSYKRRMTTRTQRELLDSYEPNFIYLKKNKKNNLYKIGFSKRPNDREKTLQSEDPEVFTYKKWIAPQRYESKLKKRFANKRRRGEWFALSAEDLEIIENFMSKFYISRDDAIIGPTLKILENLAKRSISKD